MTQEQKARAYDKAREKIAIRFGSNVAKEIFSEYEESDDERIKREILELVSIAGSGNQFEEIKDWLEKQIEKKTIINPKFRVGDEIREALIKAFKEYPKNAVKYWHDIVIEDIIIWLEKQGEQRYLTGVDLGDPAGDKGCIFNYSDATIPQKDFAPFESDFLFKVKYEGKEYKVKKIGGMVFYGIEDESNHINYVQAEDCKIISNYAIKENG